MALRRDENAFYQLIPSLIGLIMIIAGIIMFTGGNHSSGLVVSGFGVLLIGIGGTAMLSFGGLKVTGPVGLILVVLGLVAGSLGW